MLNRKGQESAPFELLVAVIVMGFVIFVGLQAMDQLNKQKCFNETNAKLEEMKTKLETTVTEGSPQQIHIRMSSCFNEEEETIRIKDYSEPALCAEYCGAAKNLCTLLQYYYSGSGAFSIRKCLSISPDTVFPYNVGNCPEKEGTELIDFRDEVVQGSYLLVNKTGVTSTYPTICAYRQTLGDSSSSSSTTWPTACKNQISSKLNDLKDDVEAGVSPIDLSFSTSCPELNSGTIRHITNCSSECPGSGECLLYNYSGANSYSQTKCID